MIERDIVNAYSTDFSRDVASNPRQVPIERGLFRQVRK